MKVVAARATLVVLSVLVSLTVVGQSRLSRSISIDSIEPKAEPESLGAISMVGYSQDSTVFNEMFCICDARSADGNIYFQTHWRQGEHDFVLDLSLNAPSTIMFRYSHALTFFGKKP